MRGAQQPAQPEPQDHLRPLETNIHIRAVGGSNTIDGIVPNTNVRDWQGKDPSSAVEYVGFHLSSH